METTDNRILAALPAEERARLEQMLRPTELRRGTVVFEADEPVTQVYFPTSGAVSLMIIMEDGQAVEPAIIGREGAVGVPLGLSGRSRWRSLVQVPGEAYRLSRRDLDDHMGQPGNLGQVLSHFTGLLITFSSLSAACAQLHTLEERVIRWLLLMHDRSDGDELELTQDFLAWMLGSHRPSATNALARLRDRGLIDSRRGVIHILDRPGLEAAACECYRRLRQEYDEHVTVEPRLSVGRGSEYIGSSEADAPPGT